MVVCSRTRRRPLVRGGGEKRRRRVGRCRLGGRDGPVLQCPATVAVRWPPLHLYTVKFISARMFSCWQCWTPKLHPYPILISPRGRLRSTDIYRFDLELHQFLKDLLITTPVLRRRLRLCCVVVEIIEVSAILQADASGLGGCETPERLVFPIHREETYSRACS